MENKKPYNKKDNDTFDVLYSNSPITDMEIHLFKSEGSNQSSRNTKLGVVQGNFHSESTNIATDYVLQFPEGKSLNLKALKTKDMDNLYPLSLIERYSIKLNNFKHRQKTPIYFNPETEQFVVCTDKRFLRDLKDAGKFKDKIKDEVTSGLISIKKDIKTNQEMILLNYPTLASLYKDESGIVERLHTKYREHLMNRYELQDVIVVQYLKVQDQQSHLTQNHFSLLKGNATKINNVFSTKIEFDFIKAKKFAENDYFFYEKDGSLNLTRSVHFDKEKQRNKGTGKKTLMEMAYLLGDSPETLIIPYSENNWNKLQAIKNNMASLLSELSEVLNKQKDEKGLDKPLTEISVMLENNSLLQLTNDTKPKALKP